MSQVRVGLVYRNNFNLILAEIKHFLLSNEKLTCKLGTKKSNKIKTPDGFLQHMLKWDSAGKWSTPAGSLSVTGGWGWVRVREREIRQEIHGHQLDLSLSQVVGVGLGWEKREIRPKTHTRRPDLSLLQVVGIGSGWEKEKSSQKPTHTNRISLWRRWSGWEKERFGRKPTHASRISLFVGGRGWVEVKNARSLFPSPDLSLSLMVRPGQYHGGANRFFLLDGAGCRVL